MAKIKLEIISPNKVVYSADIDMLIVRSIAGDLGIMPKHAPLLAGLVPHAMRAIIDGTENLIAVSGGFIRFNLIKLLYLQVQQNFLLKLISIEREKLMNVHKNISEDFKENPEVKGDVDTLALELHSNVLKQDLKQLKQILVNI